MKSLLISCLVLPLALAAAEQGPTPAPDTSRSFLERLFGGKSGDSKPLKVSTATPEPWIQHAPGSLPPGKAINESEAAKLTEKDYTGQTIYLTGDFDVTAVGDNRVILRYAPSPTSSRPIRIIVEYPKDAAMPRQGMRLKIDEKSGLLLRSAKSTGDNAGTLNLLARQIGKPEK